MFIYIFLIVSFFTYYLSWPQEKICTFYSFNIFSLKAPWWKDDTRTSVKTYFTIFFLFHYFPLYLSLWIWQSCSTISCSPSHPLFSSIQLKTRCEVLLTDDIAIGFFWLVTNGRTTSTMQPERRGGRSQSSHFNLLMRLDWRFFDY